MPPKPKFTKEEITNAALTVAREKGIAAVSAREVALVLGTSTRPIFTYFRTMDELKKEVRQFAENIFQNYVEKGLAMDPPFLGVGVQYLAFAHQEPELYKLLYMSPPRRRAMQRAGSHEPGAGAGAEPLMEIYHIDALAADRYFRDMWLVVHSLCSLIVTGNCAFSQQEVQQLLTGLQPEPVQGLEGSAGLRRGNLRPGRSLSQDDWRRRNEGLKQSFGQFGKTPLQFTQHMLYYPSEQCSVMKLLGWFSMRK